LVASPIPEIDVSGKLPLSRHPGLLAAIEMIEAGRADQLVVACFDRLVRSLKRKHGARRLTSSLARFGSRTTRGMHASTARARQLGGGRAQAGLKRFVVATIAR